MVYKDVGRGRGGGLDQGGEVCFFGRLFSGGDFDGGGCRSFGRQGVELGDRVLFCGYSFSIWYGCVRCAGWRKKGRGGAGWGHRGKWVPSFPSPEGGGVRRERTGCVLQAGGGREVPWFPPQKIESRLDVLATCMSGLDSRPVAGALHPAYPKHAGANSLPAEQHVHVFRPNGWLSRV